MLLRTNITANLSGKVRNAQLGGEDYLVVPMVMITEGVHTGSGGAVYYPADELKKLPVTWNNKPVVVTHPTDATGAAVSACTPEMIDKYAIGLIMNTRWVAGRQKKPGKLIAEAWIKVNLAQKIEPRILDSINADRMMELSTGLFTDNEAKAGTFGTKTYDAIARNHRPDHLAILPDDVGACSVADGAGFLRINSATRDALEQFDAGVIAAASGMLDAFIERAETIIANGMSYADITEATAKALRSRMGDNVWVTDVFDGYIIYSSYDPPSGPSRLFKLGYTTGSGGVKLDTDTPVEVQRVSEYRAIEPTTNSEGVKETMNRTTLIAALIANSAGGWTDADKADLESMSDSAFNKIMSKAGLDANGKKITANNAEPPVPQTTPPPAPVAPVVPAAPVANAAAPVAPTWEQIVATADPRTRDMLTNSAALYNEQCNGFITTILANKGNVFTDAQLRAMDLGTLRNMAALAAASAPAPVANNAGGGFAPIPNYGGAAGGFVNNANNGGAAPVTIAPLGLPNTTAPAK